MKITVGADPEIFLKRGAQAICPYDYMQPSKEVHAVSSAGGVNRDGMALELNPMFDTDADAVWDRMKSLMAHLQNVLTEFSMNMVSDLVVNTESAIISPEAKDVWDIGCMPDLDAYTERYTDPSVDAATFPFRFAGGHITFGGQSHGRREACHIVRTCLDPLVGLLATALHPSPSACIMRKQVYGKAGAFRLKENIIEYRTPDASWLWNNSFPYLARAGQWGLETGFSVDDASIQMAINTCDRALAGRLLKKYVGPITLKRIGVE